MITLKPKNDELCDNCGTNIIQRNDDREEIGRERYKIYQRNTYPVIEFYRKNNTIITIDGSKDVEEVTKELFNMLRRFRKNDNN